MSPSIGNISIHVPRAGYDRRRIQFCADTPNISIHVPRAGYDGNESGVNYVQEHFYPRTPCGVRRGDGWRGYNGASISIHVPRAGYDADRRGHRPGQGHFYPRTPCGVRLSCCICHIHKAIFLSTYPVRGTTSTPLSFAALRLFLSTYPVRGTTKLLPQTSPLYGISIHVPRAGYDTSTRDIIDNANAFLSTYPVRGTTGGPPERAGGG
mgnify:CR=1 FL=1